MAETTLVDLTPAWEVFCTGIARGLNVKEAANEAGVRYYTACVYLRTNPVIRQRVADLMRSIVDRSNIDATELLNRMVELADADLIDCMDDNGQWKKLSEWPAVWRKRLVSVETSPWGTPIKCKFIHTLDLLKTIGTHVNVAAFEEKHRHIHDVSETLAERMKMARSRTGQVIEHEPDDRK